MRLLLKRPFFYKVHDTLLLIKAFIFVKALKLESYFDDYFKLLEIENNKYTIMAKSTNVRLFSRNLVISNIFFMIFEQIYYDF